MLCPVHNQHPHFGAIRPQLQPAQRLMHLRNADVFAVRFQHHAIRIVALGNLPTGRTLPAGIVLVAALAVEPLCQRECGLGFPHTRRSREQPSVGQAFALLRVV